MESDSKTFFHICVRLIEAVVYGFDRACWYCSILGKQEKDGHYPGGILDVGSMDDVLHNTIKYAKKSTCMGLLLVFFITTTWQVKCQRMSCFY